MNRRGTYNPEIELQKGATLTAGSYDKTQGNDHSAELRVVFVSKQR